MKFALNFHYFCFPLYFFLVLLSYKQGQRFHSCEGLWHSWDETSPMDISPSDSGASLDTQLWKARENILHLAQLHREKSQREAVPSSHFLQRSAGSWPSKNTYKELRRMWCDLWSQKIIPRSYTEPISTHPTQPISEANPSFNMWHLKDCWVEIWCEHSISCLFVFFLLYQEIFTHNLYSRIVRCLHREFVNRAWKYMM